MTDEELMADRRVALLEAVEMADEYFQDEQQVETWFTTPNPFLGNVSPFDMIKSGRSKKLLAWMRSMRAGEGP